MKIILFTIFVRSILMDAFDDICIKFSKQEEYDCVVLNNIERTIFEHDGLHYYLIYSKRDHKQNKILRVRDVSDPAVKERTMKSAEWLKTFSKLESIPEIEKSDFFDNYYAEILNIDSIWYKKDKILEGWINMSKEMGELFQIMGLSFVEFNRKQVSVTETSIVNLMKGNGFKSFIFTNLEGVVKIGDPVNDQSDFQYWEPDRLAGKLKVYSAESDVYAFGVWLYKNANAGLQLFPGNTKEEYAKGAAEGNYEWDNKQPLEMGIIVHLLLLANSSLRLKGSELAQFGSLISAVKKLNYPKQKIILNNKVPLNEALMEGADEGVVKFYKEWVEIQTRDAKRYQNSGEDEENGKSIISKWKLVIGGFLVILIVAIVWWLLSKRGQNEAVTTEENKNTTPLDSREVTKSNNQTADDHRVEIESIK